MFPKKVYMFCVFLNQTCSKKEIKNSNSQILFVGHLVKFILVINLASLVRQETFVLGLGFHLS